MLSSFEGDLELLEQGQLWGHSSATSVWTHRWCALSNGVIRVYADRTAAIAQPEACLRSIPLETFAHLRTVGPSSEGAWELVLSSSAPAPSAAKRPQRMLPRSATSASLSQAFERSSPTDHRLATESPEETARRFSWGRNQSKRSATLMNAQQQGISEALDAAEDKPRGSSLTLNKLSLRSKRLYRLLSGNGNSSSSLSELAGTPQSASRPSSRAGSVRSPFATTFAEASAGDTVYLRARHTTAMTQWSDAISACHAALLSSHDTQHSLPRTSSTHFRPAIPSFEGASASHMTTSQSTSRIMRGAADFQSHFRRRREDHTRNAPSAASAMIHASMANDERRHASADYSPRNSMNIERIHTIERPQTSGAGSLRSSLSMRRPSTSTGTSRPSTSSGRQMSETTAASSPPSSFSAMRLNRARSERRSNNSSPRLSKASLFDEPAAMGRPGSSDTLIPSSLDVRVDAASRGNSMDALRPPSNASNHDGRESRFSMLRKASASSMSQPEFNGACLGLGLDLGRDPTLDASATRLRNASLAKREYPPPAPSNGFKQHRKQKSVSASDIYGSGRIAVAASASAEFLAAPASTPRAMSRSPSLFNLSAKLVSATTGNSRRGSSSTDSAFRSGKSKSPLNVASALPATGDSSFGSDSAYEFVPPGSEGHASIPVISLDGCEPAARATSPGTSAPLRGYKNAVRLTMGARRITSPLSSPQPLLDAASSSHSEASSSSPVTPISPLWPPVDAGAADVLSLKSSNSSGATISAVDHGVASGAVRPASRGGFTTVTMQRILPPTELIATLDRMRATEDASPTEHAASSELSHEAMSRPRSASAGGLSSLVISPQPKARRNEGRSVDEPISSDASRRTRAPASSTQQRSSYEHSLPAPPRTVKRASPSPIPAPRSRVLEPLQTRTAEGNNTLEARQSSSDFKVRLRRPTTPEYGSRLRGNSISTLGRSRPSPANSPSASPRRALL